MGPRLLCFASGAALSAFFVHLGLLATPFFGAGAFLWANVFASFLLALALGVGLGDLVATGASRKDRERAAPRLAAAGGVAAWLAAYLLPTVCRTVLEVGPDSTFAPAVAMVVASVVPGALLAAVTPSELRSRLQDQDGGTVARIALRLLGLFALGAVVGVALTARPVLRADEVDVWLHAYAGGGLMALLALAYLGNVGRVVTGLGVAGCAGLAVGVPSEVQSTQYAVALEQSWDHGKGASLYYLRTTQEELLSDEQLEQYTSRVKADVGRKPGIILTCELLKALGQVTVTGEGLRRSLDLLLPPDAEPYLMPIFEQFESIRSDDEGMLYVQIERTGGEEGARCRIPGAAPGEFVEFWFRDDFTVHLTHEEGVWRMEFGPLTTEKAGVFDFNDTYRTPIELPDVALWVDASLLGIVIENHPDQVVVKAVAQGSIGEVQTVEIQAIAKGEPDDGGEASH